MIPIQLLNLVIRLRARTEEGKMRWERVGDATFATSLRSGAVSVTSRDGDGDFPFVITVRDPEGAMVEDIEVTLAENGAEVVKGLYFGALRSATGASELIGRMLKEVDDDIPF
jgi:hypothetical protein